MFKSIKLAFIFIGIFTIIFLILWFIYEPFKKEQRPFGVPIDQILIKEQIKDITPSFILGLCTEFLESLKLQILI